MRIFVFEGLFLRRPVSVVCDPEAFLREGVLLLNEPHLAMREVGTLALGVFQLFLCHFRSFCVGGFQETLIWTQTTVSGGEIGSDLMSKFIQTQSEGVETIVTVSVFIDGRSFKQTFLVVVRKDSKS